MMTLFAANQPPKTVKVKPKRQRKDLQAHHMMFEVVSIVDQQLHCKCKLCSFTFGAPYRQLKKLGPSLCTTATYVK